MLDANTLDRGADGTERSDRRRPGRGEVSPGLIALLRGRTSAQPVAEDRFDEDWAPRDPIAPPRGIGLAFALCTPFWIGIGSLVYALIW